VPATTQIDVIGVKDTVKALRRLDPELRKQFNRDIKGVLQPAISKIKASYPTLPLSGMANEWIPPSGYQILPWTISKVRSGVRVKTATRRNKNAVVYVSQANPAGVLFETVSLNNELGRNIRTVSPRVMWPVIDQMAPQIFAGVEGIVVQAQKVVDAAVVEGKVVFV